MKLNGLPNMAFIPSNKNKPKFNSNKLLLHNLSYNHSPQHISPSLRKQSKRSLTEETMIPEMVRRFYERQIIKEKVNAGSIIVNEKSSSLGELQMFYQNARREEKFKGYRLINSLDLKDKEEILKSLKDRPSQVVAMMKNKIIKSKKKLLSERKQTPHKKMTVISEKVPLHCHVIGQELIPDFVQIPVKRQIWKASKKLKAKLPSFKLGQRVLKREEHMVQSLSPWEEMREDRLHTLDY